MAYLFPAVGHKYLVDFTADDGSGQFKVQLDFHSATSLTPAGFNSERNFAVASRLNCLSEASIQRKKRFRLASANRGLLNSE